MLQVLGSCKLAPAPGQASLAGARPPVWRLEDDHTPARDRLSKTYEALQDLGHNHNPQR